MNKISIKKKYIVLLIILTTGVFLFLNWQHDLLFSSQNNIISINKTNKKKDISSKINSILSKKKVIKPINKATLIIFKAEKKASFFVTDSLMKHHLISSHSVELSSTINGTKLYDKGIRLPEGVYSFMKFQQNPTPYISLNFPNKFDIDKQEADKRPPLTTEISIGISDNNIVLDSVFFNNLLLFSDFVKHKNTEIIIVPNDFRNGKPIPFCLTCPPWIEELYGQLRLKLAEFN